MNATSGNISPNPEGCAGDHQESCREHKLKDQNQPDDLDSARLVDSDVSRMEEDELVNTEGIKEEVSDEEEDEEDVEEEDVDVNLSMLGVNTTVGMSLEDARYALKQIEKEKSMNDSAKKSLKPPYRYNNHFIFSIYEMNRKD